MSAVKEFYLTRYSKCPKCHNDKLKHLKTTTGLGANFKCESCKVELNFKQYIEYSLTIIETKPLMQIFERCYYEVNK